VVRALAKAVVVGVLRCQRVHANAGGDDMRMMGLHMRGERRMMRKKEMGRSSCPPLLVLALGLPDNLVSDGGKRVKDAACDMPPKEEHKFLAAAAAVASSRDLY
jgi:hypothetical protein